MDTRPNDEAEEVQIVDDAEDKGVVETVVVGAETN